MSIIFKDYTAGYNDNGRRIDKVIRNFLSNEKLSTIYCAMRKNLIKVNDTKVKPNTIIYKGDKISIAENLLKNQTNKLNQIELKEKPFPYEIIFKNNDFLVINKPYNISVHEKDSLSEKVANYYKNNTKEPSLSFVAAPLHRLDKKTTGILVFSWSIKGATSFSNAIKNRNISKKYIAIIQGKLEKQIKLENYIIAKKNNQSKYHTVEITSKNDLSKLAITTITPLAYGTYNRTNITLVECEIETGRKHQIRCQSSFIGFPLLGDTAYGGAKIKEKQDFFLHAYCVTQKETNLTLPQTLTAPLSLPFYNFIKTYFDKQTTSIISSKIKSLSNT